MYSNKQAIGVLWKLQTLKTHQLAIHRQDDELNCSCFASFALCVCHWRWTVASYRLTTCKLLIILSFYKFLRCSVKRIFGQQKFLPVCRACLQALFTMT